MECRMITLLCLGMLAGSAAARAQEPVSGAKELFYDPAGATASRMSPTPPGPKGPKVSPAPPKPVAPRPRLDSNQRRMVKMPSAPETPSSPTTALGLSYWIELAGTGSGPGEQVTERHVFRSGDRIRLHFRSNANGHIALIQLGSSGTSQFLFPDPGTNPEGAVLTADQDKILPNDSAWFRFDEKPGKERLIVLFSRERKELDSLPQKANLDEQETKGLVQSVQHIQGGKDLVIETETKTAGEVGTYGVNVAGKPVVLEIVLEHQ